MKAKWLKRSKISLLLVCVGFFLPVSCDMNGIDMARWWRITDGGLKYSVSIFLVIIAAVLSIIISIIMRNNLEDESIAVDWILLGMSIAGGIFSVSGMGFINFQIGAYLIMAGWILSLIFLIRASREKRE